MTVKGGYCLVRRFLLIMKTVIVAGASGGIGRAVCEKFAAEGYLVGVHYNGNEAEARDIADKIGGALIRFDISDYRSVDSAVTAFVERYGRLDAVVNCAGVALPIKTLLDTTESEFDRIFAVNVKGAYNLAKRAISEMLCGGGAIVNVSSMWGLVGGSCEAVYSASKAAVIGLTKALAKEYAGANIRVNAVAPGFIDTKMNDGIVGDDRLEAISEIPLGRIGKTEEVADAAYFLVENAFVTGEILNISGGEVI